MSLAEFLSAVARVSPQIAPQYGLTPQELQIALITTAAVEGGLGERPGVGDNGQSFGRFQFFTGGGHGTTLLNRGWTIEDFYDETRVVEHWAPHMARAIANAKKQGFTGGEALRQGAFALQRPFAIYPAERWNTALRRATEIAGGAPPVPAGQPTTAQQLSAPTGAGPPSPTPGPSPPGTPVPAGQDPVAIIRAHLQAEAMRAIEQYLHTRSADDYNTMSLAIEALSRFEAGQPAAAQNDPAQRAFDNAITLGDFEARQADRLYGRWRDKNELARIATDLDLQRREAHNIANVRLAEARNQSPTPGLLPRVLDAGYAPVSFDEALAKWRRTFGAEGEAPPPHVPSGIGLPPPPAAAGPGAGAVLPPAVGPGTAPAGPGEQHAPGGVPSFWPTQEPSWWRRQLPNVTAGYHVEEPPNLWPWGAALWGMGRGARATHEVGRGIWGANRALEEATREHVVPAFDQIGRLPGRIANWWFRPNEPQGPGRDPGTQWNPYTPIPGGYSLPAPSRSPTPTPPRRNQRRSGTWWNEIGTDQNWWHGIPRLARGTVNHPGGPAFVNEKGPEMVIPPDGQPYIEPGAPHVANLPPGATVLPADIPPEEAHIYAQIMQALRQGPVPGEDPADPMAQMSRAQDPELQQKVIEALRRAMAAQDAADPPLTPVLGPGVQKDYWQAWRPLTGVPAQPMATPQKTRKGVR